MWIKLKRLTNNGKTMQRYRELHLFFAKLMAICILEFILSQMPLTFILALSTVKSNPNIYKIQSTAFYFAYLTITLDAMINPLWLSFISFRRQTKIKQTHQHQETSVLTHPTHNKSTQGLRKKNEC